MRGRPKLFDSSEWYIIEKFFSFSSPGWYFKGDNLLEITGGPNFRTADFGGTPLKITRKIVTPEIVAPEIILAQTENVNLTQNTENCENTDSSQTKKMPTTENVFDFETSFDAIFENMDKNQPHIKIQKIKNPKKE